jgi:polygalacturonase
MRIRTRTTPLLTTFLISAFILSCHMLTEDPWDRVPSILKQIKAPQFQEREFDITDFGAVGDGITNCTEAFERAIDSCNVSGGGRVLVPEGTFLTGPIHLKSNVDLHMSKESMILFSTEFNDFLPVVYTRYEGVECMNYSPMIYSFEQENIAVTGSGTLDGQAGADNWWSWKGLSEFGWENGQDNGRDDAKKLFKMGDENVPVSERVFGQGHQLRVNFIQFYKCSNILLDSITIKRSPMWAIHPVLCENVTIQNLTVDSHGPNNDGCNPESSKNVLIKNCFFNTGDDCIAIKSGRNADGRRINIASENIIIQGCKMKDGHGGVVIGSEMSGNVRSVFIEDCYMDSPNLERALRIKTNSLRGGIVEDIFMRNCEIGELQDAVIKVNFLYENGDMGNFTPTVRNIYINNIRSKKSQYAIYLEGYERSPITNLIIKDCDFQGVLENNYLKNYKNLKMHNVFINGVMN